MKIGDSLVSVVVPVYNAEKYLIRCLDSVVAQSYRHIEAILVDDGSTDGSAGICDEYASKDSRFTVIHQSNKGPGEARNVALSHCSGEWICFLDSDDLMRQGMVERLYDVASRGYKLAMCSYSTFTNIDEIRDEELLETPSAAYGELTVDQCLDEFVSGWPSKNFNTRFKYGVLWNKIFHASLLKGVRFDPSLERHVDQPFCMAALIRTDKVAFIQDDLYLYNVRTGSVSHHATIDMRCAYLRSSLSMFGILKTYRESDWQPFLRKFYRQVLVDYNDRRTLPGGTESRKVLSEMISGTKRDYLSASCIPIYERLGFFVMWAFPKLFSLFLKVWVIKNGKSSGDSSDI